MIHFLVFSIFNTTMIYSDNNFFINFYYFNYFMIIFLLFFTTMFNILNNSLIFQFLNYRCADWQIKNE